MYIADSEPDELGAIRHKLSNFLRTSKHYTPNVLVCWFIRNECVTLCRVDDLSKDLAAGVGVQMSA
jgi:hypothetical protein